MTKSRLSWFLTAAAGLAGCTPDGGGSTASTPGVPQDVKAIIFLQRVPRNDGMGNVFDYTSYVAGGRLVKLEPPSADGKLTVLTTEPEMAEADIMSWDLSFDARKIVLSARRKQDKNYQLYTMNVDGTDLRKLPGGPYDYVYPMFIPGGKIMFQTSKSVEDGSPQFRDEYERATTAQMGVINIDGMAETLGPRNVSHRVAPALLPNGAVVYTEWRHLGDVNDGHLRLMNTDMTGMREAFGGEGHGITNSFLKARHVASYRTETGRDSFRLITIGTSRDDTLQAGKLLLVDLGDSEKTASVVDMTPDVPGGRSPSFNGVGRYYDAEGIGDPSAHTFLVSWANGPVESRFLAMAKTNANFGLYVFAFDEKKPDKSRRYPIYDDPAYWDVMARPLKPRPEPPAIQSPVSGQSFTVGALNVFESSIFKSEQTSSAVKVRLLEGFSSEEGFPNMFGLTEFDGQSRYGEVPIYADGSFAAKVPANVPLHMQLIDKFAMSVASEDIWVSGRPGEERFCGGCHEDRAKNTLISPGSTEAMQRGAINLDVPRAERVSKDFTYENIRGVPWDKLIQPILDAKCASCHDGDPAKPGNKQYTITDKTLGTMQTFVFDLRGQKIALVVGERREYDYPASYISLMGLGMELGENVVQVTGDPSGYIEAGSARKSKLFKKLNPPQQFPQPDLAVRAFPGPAHPTDVKGLTALEYYQFILNADMGGQFYFRENKRGPNGDMYVKP